MRLGPQLAQDKSAQPHMADPRWWVLFSGTICNKPPGQVAIMQDTKTRCLAGIGCGIASTAVAFISLSLSSSAAT